MNGWSWYWTGWFFGWTAMFMGPEFYALATGHPANTLSANVWRLEGFLPGQDVMHWTAVHLLFTACLIVFFAWLIGHFGWGIWR